MGTCYATSYAHVHAHTDTHSHVYAAAHTHAHIYAATHTHAHIYAAAHTHAHPDSTSDVDPDAYPFVHAVADEHAIAYTLADGDDYPRRHSNAEP